MKHILLAAALAALIVPAGSSAQQTLPWETLYVTGASHIDLAWKWEYSEGESVAHYTYRSMLDMMDEYDAQDPGANPVYYAQSNALTYEWMENDDPALFARIKQRVAEGRWEIVGGMWVESDAELPSGESFCRQFLEAQWYFYDKFGKMATIGWLPDSFGFNGNFPQFMKRSGIDSYFFYKIDWNDTHLPDWNLCHWIGPDGSDVHTHLAYGQYNNDGWIWTVNGIVSTKRDHEPGQPTIFYPLGTGDHGGGMTRFYLNQMLGHRDAGYKVHFGTAADFFQSVNWDNVSRRIQDEMYFERHRGTPTSRAEHKKNMRELEYKLQSAEIFSSLATLLGKADYPFAQLKDAWRRLLRDQFHDVMAGTALDAVYKVDVAQNLAQVRATGDRALNDALDFIAGNIDIPDGPEPLLLFNPNNFAVAEPVLVPGATAQQKIVDAAGGDVPCQFSETDNGLVFVAANVPRGAGRSIALRTASRAATWRTRPPSAFCKTTI
jgi:alpha-mannosidase